MKNGIDAAIAARREQEREERESRWRRDEEEFARFPRLDTHRTLADARCEARDTGYTLMCRVEGMAYRVRPTGHADLLHTRKCGAVILNGGM